MKRLIGSTLWALLLVVAMTLVRMALEPQLGINGPIIFYFGAVIGAAFFGGAVAGVLSTILSVPAIVYFFLPPFQSFRIADPTNQFLLGVFVIESLLITALAHLVRNQHASLARSEKELEEKSRLLETVLDQMPASVLVAEAPSGKIVFGSSHTEEVWRHPLIPSRCVEEYRQWKAFHEDGRPYEAAEWPLARAIRNGEIVKNEDTEVLRGDGSRGVLRMSAAPVKSKDGQTVAGVVICEDVTTRIRAEENLRAREERYRVLSDSIPTITWSLFPDGHLKYFNRRWYEYTGMTEEFARSGRWPEAMHPEDRVTHLERRTNAIASGIAYETEFRLKGKDGEFRWFESQVVPLKAADGRIIAWYGSAVDIEERKRAEAALRAAKDAAEAANQAKSQFLANMSHEIRTPMNAILGFADLLMERRVTEDERMEFSSRIKSNGDQLLHLIDDILDLSKVEAGKIPIEKMSFSFIDLIQDVLAGLAPLADRKGLDLRVSFRTAIPQVIHSDPVRLKQILTNLIGNALKFTAEGSVEVVLRFLEGQNGKSGVLSVGIDDTGIGIEPSKQKHLFQPFAQADSSISRMYGGTGLGLTLSRHLSQALGGDLFLTKSVPGRGSCFTLNIDTGDVSAAMFVSELRPGFDAEKARSLRLADPREEQLTGLNVLLAEDSPDGAALVRLYLQMEGASVQVARDGFEVLQKIESLEKAKASGYDVILMDVQMPGLDGLEVTRRLRARGYGRPIIALTAHALREEVERSMQAGCDLHLTKPIKRRDLVRGILSQVAWKESEAERV